MGRAPCCEKNGLKKGPWTPEEDQKLIEYIQRHGHGSWRALPKNAGLLRCGKSCRLRWTNYLRPDIKRGKFSFEEEQTIIQLHGVLGNKWSAIAAQIPGRTDNEIKNYWNTHLKKRLLQMGIDPVTHRPRIDLFDLSRHFLAATPNSNLISQMARWENAKLEGLRREYVLRLAAMMAQHDQNVGNCSVNDVLMRALQSRSQMNDIGAVNANNFCRDQLLNSVLCNWAQIHPDHQNIGLDQYYNMLAQEQLQIQAQISRCSAQNTDQSCSSLAPGNGSSTISSPSFQVAQHIPSPTSTLDEFRLYNSNIKMEPQHMNLQNENLLQKPTHVINTERILHELLQDHRHELQADQDVKASSNNLLSETSINGFIANIIKTSKSDLPADSEHNSGCSSHHADPPQLSQWPDQDHHQQFNDANSKIISSDAADQSVPALISSASSPNIFSETDHTNSLMPENSSTMLSMGDNYGIYAFPPDLLLDFSTEITSSSCTDHHHRQQQQNETTATAASCRPPSAASGASSWSDMKSEDAKDYWTNMLNYTIDANLQQ